MATNFPSSLDDSTTIPAESANTKLSTNHVTAHQNIQDAIEAIEAKVGVNSSAVTTSHDYKLSEVTSTDKAVGKTATQTVSNKTFTSSTYNGVTLTTGGSATDVLNAQGNYIAGAVTESSTTVKGVVELATYAETIARTTTGGTGAKLVPTPDTLTTVLTYDYQADSVGTDAYAITCTPAPTAYTTGMRFTFKAGTANTGSATLNVNSLGAKTLKKRYDQDLATGDILANQIVEVVYDGTNMQMVSSQQPAPSFAHGQATRTTGDGTGTQNIAHGLGVTPRFIRITATQYNAVSATAYSTSIGTATSTSDESCTYVSSQPSGVGPVGQSSGNIVYMASSTTNGGIASLSGLDSTNITLNWSSINATANLQWEAFA